MKQIKLFKEFFTQQHLDDLNSKSNKDIHDMKWGLLLYNKTTEELLKKFYFFEYKHNKSVEERFNTDISIILSKLEKDCQPFIKQFKNEGCNSLIYRGIKDWDKVPVIKSPNLKDHKENNKNNEHLFDLMMEKNTRKDRKPKDTPSSISKIMDDAFENQLGVRLRSQGVFGISSVGVTLHYGYPWILIPIGNFEFYWSPDVDDLWNWTEMAWDNYYQEFGDDDTKSNLFKQDMEEMASRYKKGNLKAAIQSIHEITFLCDRYLLINSMYSDAILGWMTGEYKFEDGKLIY